MNNAEKQDLAETLASVLDEHRGVDSETHKKHHEFIDQCITDRYEKRELWRSVRKQILGWGIILMLTGTGLAVADYVRHLVHMK